MPSSPSLDHTETASSRSGVPRNRLEAQEARRLGALDAAATRHHRRRVSHVVAPNRYNLAMTLLRLRAGIALLTSFFVLTVG